MEFHQVHYYVELCRTLNFTRAAEACHVTQPALTRAIQRLEEELGGPLFYRERNLTQLTELGRVVRPLLEQMLTAAESAREQADRFNKNELPSLNIGLSPTISARLMISPLKELLRRYTTLDIRVRTTDHKQLIDDLLQGRVDAAFVVADSKLPDRVNRWILFTEAFCIAFAADHPLSRLEEFPLTALQGQQLLGRYESEANDRFRDLCADAGVPLQLRHVGESEEHLQYLTLASRGMVLVPEHIPLMTELQSRPLPIPGMRRSVSLAVVHGRRYTPALDGFVKLTRTRDYVRELALSS
jgi:DNA-binding transcriptional LysR family regulator